MSLPQGYTHKFAPKWLGIFMINKFISPMAYHLELAVNYRWLHLVLHIFQLKPHIGLVLYTKPLGVLSDKDVESKYEVE